MRHRVRLQAHGARSGTMMPHRERQLALAALLALAGCRGEAEDARREWTYADLPMPTVVDTPVDGSFGFVEVGRYGTLDGPAILGAIGAVAVDERYVAVADPFACEVVLFSRQTREPLSRIGRCGSGPGEFKRVGGIALRGDSLLVFDDGSLQVAMLGPDGQQHRRLDLLDEKLTTAWPVPKVDALQGNTFVLHGGVNPQRKFPGFAGHHWMVSVMSWAPPHRRGAFLEAGPAVVEKGDMSTSPTSCLMAGTASSPARLVALNPWVPQLVIMPLDADADPSTNVLLDFLPMAPAPSEEDATRFRPSGRVDGGACGDSVALFVYRSSPRAPDASVRETAYLLAVWPHGGRHELVRTSSADQPELLGELLAAHGDSYFFAHATRFGFPVVIEMRLQHARDG